jgi:scyllo-inositol 2-dehydrogenase (NADP+)
MVFYKDKMRQIKAGVIGFGLSGRYFFSPFIDEHSGFVLNSVVSSQKELVNKEYPGAMVLDSVDDIFMEDDLDLIVVASPNHTHFEYARKALEHGKHVVLEKPFTVTLNQADELISLARTKSLVLAPFQNRRWDGDFMTVKKIIGSGTLGDIVEFESHFDRYRPLYDRVQWKNDDLPGNGVLYDLGPHLIDQALALFGRPDSLFAEIKTHRLNGKIDDYFDLHIYYGNMKAILKAGVVVREPGPRFIVHGRKGSFIKYGLDPQENNLRNACKPGKCNLGDDDVDNYGLIHTEIGGKIIKEKVKTEPGSYMQFFENLYGAIAFGEQLEIKPSDGRNIIEIIEMAYLSNKSKRIIKI